MHCPSCQTPNPAYFDYCTQCHVALDGSGHYEQGHSASGPLAPEGQEQAQAAMPKQSDPVLAYVERKHALEQKHKSGAGWFYWITGMSLLNTLLMLGGSTTHFVTGLGLTTFIEALALELNKQANPLAGLAKVFAIGFDVLAVGLFLAFAVFARKGRSWAYVAGMILYALDTLALVPFKDWMGIGFHVFALFGLYGGYRAWRDLQGLTPPTSAEGAPDLAAQAQA